MLCCARFCAPLLAFVCSRSGIFKNKPIKNKRLRFAVGRAGRPALAGGGFVLVHGACEPTGALQPAYFNVGLRDICEVVSLRSVSQVNTRRPIVAQYPRVMVMWC